MPEHRITSHMPAESPSEKMIIAEGDDITAVYETYIADESRLQGGPVEKLFFPLSEADVCTIVCKAVKEGKPLTISGARTGITGGAVPLNGYLVSLEKMNSISNIEKKGENYLVSFQPGVTVETLADLVSLRQFDPSIPGADMFNSDNRNYLYPVDPTERTASLGGTCATNASGARTFYYGPTRNFIERLSVVLDNGEVIDIERGIHSFDESGSFTIEDSDGRTRTIPLPSYKLPRVKHAAGYYAEPGMDLIDLFIGSEGTLGIITRITVKVIPVDFSIFSAAAFFPSNENAIDFSIRARSSENVCPLALEFFDSNTLNILKTRKDTEGSGSTLKDIPFQAGAAVYFEQGYGTEDEMFEAYEAWDCILSECESSMEQTWGGIEEEEKKTLKDFRHAVPESVNTIISHRRLNDSRIHKVGTDMSVPDEHLRNIYRFYCEECGKSGLEYVVFGHIGDNHLHVNILPRTYEELCQAEELYLAFAQKAVSMGGSVAAEHGIGKIKIKFLSVMFGNTGISEMKNVRSCLDPARIFSPGNLFE